MPLPQEAFLLLCSQPDGFELHLSLIQVPSELRCVLSCRLLGAAHPGFGSGSSGLLLGDKVFRSFGTSALPYVA